MRRHAVFLLAAVALVAFVVLDTWKLGLGEQVVSWSSRRWSRQVEQGARLVEQGHHAEAAALLVQLDAVFPARHVKHALDTDRERLLASLASAYEGLGRQKRARDTYERLVDFDRRNYRNHYLLAKCLWRQGRDEDAEAALRDALAIAPYDLPSLAALVEVLSEGGHHDAVTRAFEDYLDAVLLADVVFEFRQQRVTAPVPVDGRFREVRARLAVFPGDRHEIALRSGGFAVELGTGRTRTPPRAGEMVDAARTAGEIAPERWRAHGMAPAGPGVFRPLGEDAALRAAPPAHGVAELALRLRLLKPVDPATWRRVELGYRGAGDADELAAARGRIAIVGEAR